MKMTKRIGKVIVRILFVSLYAFLVMKLVQYAMPDDVEYQAQIPKRIFAFCYILFFNLNTEGNLFFDRYLNKNFPWFDLPERRIFLQAGLIMLWTVITIGLPFTAWYFINGKSLAYPPASVIIFTGSVVFLFAFIGIVIARNFFQQWQISLLDSEHYKQEKLKADYRVLQNQVNPHFLFNSLNALISEIKHDPDTAVSFTRKLSKIYRYVLQSKNYELISLEKELKFIDSFIFLHKVRIGDALAYSVDISEGVLAMQLPPMTLHILIENAIKHNVANEENVLKISIESNGGNKLVVSNNIQPFSMVESTYSGLSNLNKRFALLGQSGFMYAEHENEFVVVIPLIEE